MFLTIQNINNIALSLIFMFSEISKELKNKINGFHADDSLILNNKIIPLSMSDFQQIRCSDEAGTIAFIDGGQAEILSAANFCLSFIRVAALILNGAKKEIIKQIIKLEFYLLTTAKYHDGDIYYESKIFGDLLLNGDDLSISSNDLTIRIGQERAPVTRITNMARRFSELSLADGTNADFIVLDGTLEKTFRNEEKYLDKLAGNVSALAKSSSLFTKQGNSPVVLLNRFGLEGCWKYSVGDRAYFVKLHPSAKHVFRFEGDDNVLPILVNNCSDALFLGYPYGLVAVDRLARVSEAERKSLKMRFLLQKENKEIIEYLHTSNAHELLDSLG